MAKVLLVDDNADERLIYSTILTHNGHDVEQAAEAITALELARTTAPHVILMDLQLPIMNGLLATELLRKLPETAGIPVICMTGYDITSSHATAAGCTRLLRKPLDPRLLTEAVQEVLQSDPQI